MSKKMIHFLPDWPSGAVLTTERTTSDFRTLTQRPLGWSVLMIRQHSNHRPHLHRILVVLLQLRLDLPRLAALSTSTSTLSVTLSTHWMKLFEKVLHNLPLKLLPQALVVSQLSIAGSERKNTLSLSKISLLMMIFEQEL